VVEWRQTWHKKVVYLKNTGRIYTHITRIKGYCERMWRTAFKAARVADSAKSILNKGSETFLKKKINRSEPDCVPYYPQIGITRSKRDVTFCGSGTGTVGVSSPL